MSRNVHGRTSVAEDMDVRERPEIHRAAESLALDGDSFNRS